MSQVLLQIVGPIRLGKPVDDRLRRHRSEKPGAAIDEALCKGTGGASLFCTDGEPHGVVVVLQANKYSVFTAYAGAKASFRSRVKQSQWNCEQITRPLCTAGEGKTVEIANEAR